MSADLPLESSHILMLSLPTEGQTYEEEPFYRSADYRDDQGTGGRGADGRDLPEAWAIFDNGYPHGTHLKQSEQDEGPT